MTIFLQGLAVGAGLIIAIGAQNAFVLSQGIRRQNYLLVPLICSICDIGLIIIGVAGMGTLVANNHILKEVATWGGVVFLTWYGVKALVSAYNGVDGGLKTNGKVGRKKIVLTTLSLTLLNPHVYLDTVVLLGSISGQHQGSGRFLFGFGASVASLIWFFTLSVGGSALAPIFKKKRSWQVLDVFVALTMFTIAIQLLVNR